MASLASQSATSVIFLPVEGSKTSTRFLPAASTHLPPIQRSVGTGKGAGPDLGAEGVRVWVMGLSSGFGGLGSGGVAVSGGKRCAVAGERGAGDRFQRVHVQQPRIV